MFCKWQALRSLVCKATSNMQKNDTPPLIWFSLNVHTWSNICGHQSYSLTSYPISHSYKTVGFSTRSVNVSGKAHQFRHNFGPNVNAWTKISKRKIKLVICYYTLNACMHATLIWIKPTHTVGPKKYSVLELLCVLGWRCTGRCMWNAISLTFKSTYL